MECLGRDRAPFLPVMCVISDSLPLWWVLVFSDGAFVHALLKGWLNGSLHTGKEPMQMFFLCPYMYSFFACSQQKELHSQSHFLKLGLVFFLPSSVSVPE